MLTAKQAQALSELIAQGQVQGEAQNALKRALLGYYKALLAGRSE